MAVFVAIGIARTVVELWAQQHINRQAITRRGPSEPAGWHLRLGDTFANNFNMSELFDDVAIAGHEHPDIGPGTERPGECGGNSGQSAHADEVIHLRRYKEYFQEKPLEMLNMLLCKNGSNFLI